MNIKKFFTSLFQSLSFVISSGCLIIYFITSLIIRCFHFFELEKLNPYIYFFGLWIVTSLWFWKFWFLVCGSFLTFVNLIFLQDEDIYEENKIIWIYCLIATVFFIPTLCLLGYVTIFAFENLLTI